MTSYEPLAYFHLIKFWNLQNFVTILNFLMGLSTFCFSHYWLFNQKEFKKSLMKVHNTFKLMDRKVNTILCPMSLLFLDKKFHFASSWQFLRGWWGDAVHLQYFYWPVVCQVTYCQQAGSIIWLCWGHKFKPQSGRMFLKRLFKMGSCQSLT